MHSRDQATSPQCTTPRRLRDCKQGEWSLWLDVGKLTRIL